MRFACIKIFFNIRYRYFIREKNLSFFLKTDLFYELKKETNRFKYHKTHVKLCYDMCHLKRKWVEGKFAC